jgi:hypothetical protein
MRTLYLILYIIAAVLFVVAAFVAWSPPANATAGRVNLLALGLLAWVLVPLIQTADRLGD